MTVRIIRDAKELMAVTLDEKKSGKSIGLVPTMGFLHAGHQSLIRAAREKTDFVVVSDFVNPTQFGPTEDYAAYPRDEKADLKICEECGADVLYIPTVESMYPNGQGSTWVEVQNLGNILCGASRPIHFRGVATVVTKLLFASRADFAFFGEKDYQQLTILRRMVEDLCCPAQIVGMPLVREADGLALSSRNVYLSDDARKQALSLNRGLKRARLAFQNGQRDVKKLIAAAHDEIAAQNNAQIEYIKIADPDNLDLFEDGCTPDKAIMLMAVRVGGVRLIDNMRLDDHAIQ